MRTTRRSTAPLCLLVTASLLPVGLLGCLAQQADMKRVEATLDRRITDLDQRDRARAEEIQAAKSRIDQQEKYAKELFRVARARSRQDLRELRSEELVGLHGKLEEADHFLKRCQEDIDDIQQRMAGLTQALAAQKTDSAERVQTVERSQRDRLAGLESDQQALRQELDRMQQTVRDELGEVHAYMEALRPTLESLTRKIDLQLEKQDKAILANAATAHSLGAHLRDLRAALLAANPDLDIPTPPTLPFGVDTAPPTPSDPAEGPRPPGPSDSPAAEQDTRD